MTEFNRQFIIPDCVPSQNELNKKHWAKKHKERKALTKAMRVLSMPRMDKRQVIRHVHFMQYRRQRIQDSGNLIGGHKLILDAMTHANLIYDDRDTVAPIWIIPVYEQDTLQGRRKQTIITVRDAYIEEVQDFITKEQKRMHSYQKRPS